MNTQKRFRCQYKSLHAVWVSAVNTSEAGRKAAEAYAGEGFIVDELCIDVQASARPMPRKDSESITKGTIINVLEPQLRMFDFMD